jgi:hypothetical protein
MSDALYIETRLWDFIDGLVTAEEHATIEKLIAENKEWRRKYNELLDLHQMIEATELEQPSLRFTKNVMDNIAAFQIAPATKKYINNRIIWGIALFFITLIVGFIVYGIVQIDWSAAVTKNSGINLSEIDYSKMFNNDFVNAFMMANVILGLMLLDRILTGKNKELLEDK